MSRFIVFIISISFFSFTLHGQDLKTLQPVFIEAEYFFVNEEYEDALPLYSEVYEKAPDNANIAYRIGVCYLNIPGKKDQAIEYLETASANMSARYKEGTISQKAAPYYALYDLANAYRVNYQFNKAKEVYERYTGTLLPGDIENLSFVRQQIRSCDIAKELISKPSAFKAENMGTIFNDEKSNFNPVIAADGKTFAFMVSLKFYNAIMATQKVNGKWNMPVNITPDLQLDGDAFISCLSSDGATLFMSKDDNYNSDIYMSLFDGTKWGKATKLNKNINTKYWESHGFISEDGSLLIFASDRPGGSGGLDLYLSTKINGDWGPAVNMGPVINTPFNEDRPFLINKGKTLYFSSQGHTNMGGYDIFRSELRSSNSWSDPVNLGYPLNTPDDNFFFMPTGDGKKGFYSIFREDEGEGREDIYQITFK
jgi:tetratricopeptide (TPR) repeat protein